MPDAPIPHQPTRPTSGDKPEDTGPHPGDTANPAGAPGADPELRPGARPVPEYGLLAKLGEGGFGQVWKARDDNGFEVALKFLRLDGRGGATELRAVEVMRNVRHAHVLPMFRAWQVGNWLVLALELGDKTLYRRLAEAEGQGQVGIPRPELLESMAEAAKGLDYLHTLNIQHRDVKPQNLLLVGGSVKVADFGLAKLLEHSAASNSGSLTAAYAAPEQFQGHVSLHSDQYSLAVSYCQLRGGRLPFRGGQHQMMFGHILDQPDLSMLPEAECPAVAKALAKQPEQRWPSCRAFAEALAAGAREPPVVVRQRPQPLDCTGEAGVSAADVREAQEAWATYLGRKAEETVEIAGGVTMTFVLVPPGKFRMGSPDDEKDRDKDETLHTVVLTEPFDLGKYEVTQQQYQALTGKNPSYFQGSDLPVEQVSWEEARDFGIKLSERRSDQHVYHMPTGAEWEYACRGGRPSSQPFGIGGGRSLSSREANFDGNHPYGGADTGPYLEKIASVGSYRANALGLYDMHGNVWEWCADRYGPYPDGELTDPTGPAEGPHRVIRGGGWGSFGWDCRAANRIRLVPGYRYFNLGFRLARSVVPSGGK